MHLLTPFCHFLSQIILLFLQIYIPHSTKYHDLKMTFSLSYLFLVIKYSWNTVGFFWSLHNYKLCYETATVKLHTKSSSFMVKGLHKHSLDMLKPFKICCGVKCVFTGELWRKELGPLLDCFLFIHVCMSFQWQKQPNFWHSISQLLSRNSTWLSTWQKSHRVLCGKSIGPHLGHALPTWLPPGD